MAISETRLPASADLTWIPADNARGKGTLLYNSPKVQAFASYLTQDAFVEEFPLTLAANDESGDLEQGRIEAKLHYTRNDAEEHEIEQQTGRPAYREYQNATTAGATLTGFKRLFDDHVFTLGASWQREQAENMDFDRNIQFRERFLDSPMRNAANGSSGPVSSGDSAFDIDPGA